MIKSLINIYQGYLSLRPKQLCRPDEPVYKYIGDFLFTIILQTPLKPEATLNFKVQKKTPPAVA